MSSRGPIFHRIHPLTILVELPRALRQLGFVFIIVIFQMFRGGVDGETQFELWASVLGLLVVVPAFLRYYFFGYAIHEGNLLVKSGVFTKNLRTIPLSRIQNINLTRSLLHRLLGLVDLQIETAVGGKAEAQISALQQEKAHVLKAQLSGDRPQAYAPAMAERSKIIIYKPTMKEILLVGASENRAGAIIAAIVGLSFFQPMLQRFLSDAEKESLSSLKDIGANNILIGVILFGGFILFGWFTSIVSTFIKYHGFEILEDGPKIKRQFGLFNHVENVIPINRIQVVQVHQNFVQKWLKICKLFADTAGGLGGSQNQSDQAEVQRTPLLSPVVRDSERERLIHILKPDINLSNPDWQKVSQKTIWRHLRSSIIPSLIVTGATAYWIKLWAIPLFFGFLFLGIFGGYRFFKTARWADLANSIAVRTGWLKRVWSYCPCDKVQVVTMNQSPAQRALKLATISMGSASTTFSVQVIEDLEYATAESLAWELHRRSATTRDTLVDGI